MTDLVHRLLLETAKRTPEARALSWRKSNLSYEQLAGKVKACAYGLLQLDLGLCERVAVYLPKRLETVTTIFAASLAGASFVPVNPMLKPRQVEHILRDCGARILVTSKDRLPLLEPVLRECHDLHSTIVVDADRGILPDLGHVHCLSWEECTEVDPPQEYCFPNRIDVDMAAILYTSGSTGSPKGVVLSHRNLVTGAHSVAQYLENRAQDRLLAVLPFSFDYGLSQLTTAFSVGAGVVLMDYLLPRDVIKAVAREGITGLAAVPPLWVQLAQLPWPQEAVSSLRYITNSGGAMPTSVVQALGNALPETRVYLMYGLTEAFRSTYLPPEELPRRPESMGKAIPNAEILVVREDGSPCAPGEPGELVHRGALVAMGYWNDPERTSERFRPSPIQSPEIPVTEMAVWSGDTVRQDEEGFCYFIGRKDEMIKTSGYRVSPTEIEEVLYSTGLVSEAVALGIPHPQLGQAIVVVARPETEEFSPDALLVECKKELANYMVPQKVLQRDRLPRNPNGKIDRRKLADELQALFQE